MAKPTPFVRAQRALKERAKQSWRMFWPASNGTYDPEKKLTHAWARWSARRALRGNMRRVQLAISRGEAG